MAVQAIQNGCGPRQVVSVMSQKVPVIEIDAQSGFCFGVVGAIRCAEQHLADGRPLYCLGDIVHNADEVERLRKQGLETITHEDLPKLAGSRVLLRAHGEPPSTYRIASENGIEIIDATCPVVLQLQKRIKLAYETPAECRPLIIIYGKRGHAEVNGLVGQTCGEAVVVEHEAELDALDLDRDVELYSQTTKSLSGFRNIVEAIKKRKKAGGFKYFDTICRQVSNRMAHIREFAQAHEVVIFVCGAKSSNGKALFEECRRVNPASFMVVNQDAIRPEWFHAAKSVGICGATSTPSWLMNKVKSHIEEICSS